ncbi:MAG: AzlD domain-containing protein [Acholeplasmatales bacterium]|nr:AzlD domain-containing protein [Acholeplasmatales bacterium]
MAYSIICMIIMSVTTYVLRVTPILVFKKEIKNQFIKSFLFYIPYAVIASITFPFIFYFVDNIILALIGIASTIILSLIKPNLFIVSLGSVLIVYLCSFMF